MAENTFKRCQIRPMLHRQTTQNAYKGKELDKMPVLQEQVPGSCYPAVRVGARRRASSENRVQ